MYLQYGYNKNNIIKNLFVSVDALILFWISMTQEGFIMHSVLQKGTAFMHRLQFNSIN
jgi:hypothetical protein